jgi:hypothetical protein
MTAKTSKGQEPNNHSSNKILREEEAFKHEIYMIAMFGRKDVGTGILSQQKLMVVKAFLVL